MIIFIIVIIITITFTITIGIRSSNISSILLLIFPLFPIYSAPSIFFEEKFVDSLDNKTNAFSSSSSFIEAICCQSNYFVYNQEF